MQRGRLGPPSAARQMQAFDGVQAPHGTADNSSRPPSSAGGVSDFAGSSSSLYPAAAGTGFDHASSSTTKGSLAQNQDGSAHIPVPRFGASASSTYSEQHGAAFRCQTPKCCLAFYLAVCLVRMFLVWTILG